MKKENLLTVIFSAVFATVGLFFLIAGIITMQSGRRFQEMGEEIQAEITDILKYRDSRGKNRYEVYVDYIYDGKSYRNIRLNSYSGGMDEGKEIAILCDPENPEHIEILDGKMVFGIVVGIMGGALLVGAAIPVIVTGRRTARKKKVMSDGKMLYAVIEKIDLNTGFTINGKNPYVIYCTFKDDFKDVIYRFKSDNIWTNPNLVLKEGDTIPVYVDENDFSCYCVDTEKVLKGRVIDYT